MSKQLHDVFRRHGMNRIFRLEKFIPTHCPNCAQPFRSSADGDFGLDSRFLHPESTPAEWLAVFPEAAVTDGLHTEPIWCERCHNITLRVITALRMVATEEEAELLEGAGFCNRQIVWCAGTGFSDHPDYTLSVVVPSDQDHITVTFFPRSMSRNTFPRPRT